MSFLTALLGAAGGYGAGRQQALQNKQNQEQIDAQNAYEQEQISLDKQKQKMAEDVYQRQTGIDPATGKSVQLPPALLQVAPGNKGKPATDQQEIDHLYAVANNYVQRGFPDLAAPYLDRAKSLEGILKSAQTQEATLNREVLLNNLTTNRDFGLNNLITNRDVNLQGTRDQAAMDRLLDTLSNRILLNQMTTNRDITTTGMRDQTSIANTQARIAQQISQQSNIDLREMEKQNATALRNKQPSPYPNLDNFKTGLGQAITAVSKDPKQLQTYLGRLNANAGAFGPQLTAYGRSQLEAAARESQAATAQPGGSQATGNPPPPRSFQNP